MPVIVAPGKYNLWLNPEVEDFAAVREILKPYDPSLMRHYPVNQRVNSVQNDDADCAAPITSTLPEQSSLFWPPNIVCTNPHHGVRRACDSLG